jgi:ribosomal protein S18 acetylase RimI-like enzyme
LMVARAKVSEPEGLIITYAGSPGEIRQYGAVIASLFGDSEEGRNVATYFNLLSESPMSTYPAMRHYLGTCHDQVVATGALFIGSETAGIYDIATRAEYRHRGIGSAMFAYLLNEARSYQHRYVVLQASAEGIGIYLKAGFTPIGDVHTFENRTLL